MAKEETDWCIFILHSLICHNTCIPPEELVNSGSSMGAFFYPVQGCHYPLTNSRNNEL